MRFARERSIRRAAWGRLAAFVACGVAGSALAQVPIRTIDVGLGVGSAPDITFDAGDAPVIVYRHEVDKALKLARGTECFTPRVLTDSMSPGYNATVALDTLGLPHVAHLSNHGDAGLLYTLDGGDAFGLATVSLFDGVPAGSPDFALDSLDRPYIVYRKDGPQLLEVASFDIQSGTWQSEALSGPPPIDRPLAIHVAAIAVDGQDRPVVAYLTQWPENSVVVARKETSGWTYRTHAFDYATSGIAVVIDAADTPLVVVPSYSGLMLLRFGILGIDMQTVTPVGSTHVGPHAAAIDTAGRLRIAYSHFATDSVYVAQNDFGWSSTLIQSDTVLGDLPPAIAVDSTGQWAVVYYDRNDASLKLAGPGVRPPTPGDLDCDDDVDADDLALFALALSGPDVSYADGIAYHLFAKSDADSDNDVDLHDLAEMQLLVAGGAP